MQEQIEQFDALGAQIWAVSADDPKRMRSFRDKKGISYNILHDPDGEIFDAYGIRNERHDKTVPHPTVVVVDQEQTVGSVFFDQRYRKRPSADEVLSAVRAVVGVDKAPTELE